jgi:hypothetical protein
MEGALIGLIVGQFSDLNENNIEIVFESEFHSVRVIACRKIVKTRFL